LSLVPLPMLLLCWVSASKEENGELRIEVRNTFEFNYTDASTYIRADTTHHVTHASTYICACARHDISRDSYLTHDS
jgi:hypothetical protein